MPRGGKREGAGRRPHSKTKATADVIALAQDYGERAIERLAKIMESDDAPHAAQVRAAAELLDRGFGKPKQTTDLTSSDGSMSPRSLSDFYANVDAQSVDTGNT